MYSVLLVDDEMNIISGLKVIIPWERLDCKIVGTAYNGVEGYELAVQLKPDIIVTDIRMPYLDGLQMITRLKAAGSLAHFIVLSGYSEFEYAKKGIELGVNYYVLKPVEEAELEEYLRKIITVIENNRNERAEMEHLQKIAAQRRENLHQFVLRDIIDSGAESPESLKDLLTMIDFPVAASQYASLLVELNPKDSWEGELSQKFTGTIREVLGDNYRVDVFAYSNTQLGIVLSMGYAIHAADLVKKINEIRYYLVQFGKGDLTIGVGKIYKEITGISKSFEEARYALGYQIIKGRNRVIFYDEVARISDSQANIDQKDILSLEAGIENANIEDCNTVIDHILHKLLETPGIRLPDIQLQCLNILMAGIRKMGPIPILLNEQLGKNLLSLEEGVFRFQTLDQLKQWLLQVIESIIELKLRNIPAKKDLITDVKEYISQNFAQNLTLAALAERFFINPFYLSQLFKEKTGETYLNYLMKVRINKAKELLETSDLKMAEVCELVGYTDTKYFSKLFEKLAGCKPSEYKALRKNRIKK